VVAPWAVIPVDVDAVNPAGSWRVITMPGSIVVVPKIERDVGTRSSVCLSSRSPIFVFSTSTTGELPETVTVS
jgi:hypothetical protein